MTEIKCVWPQTVYTSIWQMELLMANWRRSVIGGLVAAFVAMFLLVGTSAGLAMRVRCDVGHGTAVEVSMPHQHPSKTVHDHRDTACCMVTCGVCLTVLSEISVSYIAASKESSPVLSTERYMTGRAPSPDLGPPRKSV